MSWLMFLPLLEASKMQLVETTLVDMKLVKLKSWAWYLPSPVLEYTHYLINSLNGIMMHYYLHFADE